MFEQILEMPSVKVVRVITSVKVITQISHLIGGDSNALVTYESTPKTKPELIPINSLISRQTNWAFTDKATT